MWQTNSSASGDTILYDDTSRDGVLGDYRYADTGCNYTYSGASGFIHDVELTGLRANTTYYFVCGGPTGGYSAERSFRTATSISSDVRFVVGGDSRSNLVERERISETMARFNPAFVMHSGDMVNDGRVQSQWDSWFTDVDSHWTGENGLTIPIIPVLGNHENPQNVDCKYFAQLALPRNERWYSYDWGPDIHIICLDSESSASGPQRDWLENDLASHANYTWKFVLFHKPPFVSGAHSPWTPALTYWVPLFDKYHVDVVFNGHEHGYQRSYPLNWTASQTEPQPPARGTTYIVTGGWGAPLYTPDPIWYMACQNGTHHFVLVDVCRNGTLRLQAKDDLGNTFDEVKIRKSPVHDIAIVDVTTSPTELAIGDPVFTNVTVLNEGTETETFNVSVHCDTAKTRTQTATGLAAGANATFTFTWNTTKLVVGNYTIIAYASPVAGETDTTDNTLTSGWIAVTFPGDVDRDRDVDIFDIVLMAGGYGTTDGQPKFNANCDIDGDGDIDILDIVIAAGYYGESW
jgi:hypothetical protein